MEPIKTDDQELSDFHKDFLIRWMEVELERQERASASFLKERADALDAQRRKVRHNRS